MSQPSNNKKHQALALFFGGLLPVIAFTVIEDQYGVVAGLIAGMIFGAGEILYELIKYKKVSALTWGGNALLLGLGGVSLISQDGLWFKLQPALIELIFGFVLFFSSVLKKPFLVMMIEKQNPEIPTVLKQSFHGINFRLSFFFFIHAGLATYAAFYWSNTNWALLKGAGLTVSFILYLLVELYFVRRRLKP